MPVSPDRPKGPPLNALRAFEAAARLGGFLAAAEELCVTPGAVSQHIKSLEAWAGAALFERRVRGVALTALGAEVAGEFGVAFDRLGSAVRLLRAGSSQKTLAIAALPSVAQLWLAPKMPALRTALPGIDFSITAMETRPNLAREMFDFSVFLDAENDDIIGQVIAPDCITPVCAPEIAERLSSPEDLLREAWIYDASWALDWAIWLASFAPNLRLKSGSHHSLYSIALADAESGAGVMIGHTSLIADRLASGALVAPFDDRVSSGLSLKLEAANGLPKDLLTTMYNTLKLP